MRDVAIVGGGPGGLHAATLLARAGLDVVLYEEHPTSGTPVHCTGVLAADAFDELGLAHTPVLNPLHTVGFYSPSGEHVSYTTVRAEALAIDRLVFDRMLLDTARASGAAIVFGHRVEEVTVGASSAVLRFKDGCHVQARLCVLACGASYVLQRRLGLGFPSDYLQSAQLELPAAREGAVEVHFGTSVAPNGFAWVVPVRRPTGWHVRVGLMCERHSALYFRRFVARVSARWGIDAAALQAAPRQKLLPLGPIERTVGERLLAVGDAAGLVKATTGGGIYYSLLTGALAAKTAMHACARNRFDAHALARYERAWRRRLGVELDAQARLRRLADGLGDGEIETFFDLARTDGIMPIVRETARFNQHRHFIAALLRHPPARRVLLGRLRGGAVTDRRVSTGCDI